MESKIFIKKLPVRAIMKRKKIFKMKGGRMYKSILEYLTEQDDVNICRGIDLVEVINNKKCQSQNLQK